jgi:type II secretory pathway component PulK
MQPRRRFNIEVLALLLAFFSLVATCFSTYYSYQTVKLYSEQNQRERRKEWMEFAGVIGGLFKASLDETQQKQCLMSQNANGTKENPEK